MSSPPSIIEPPRALELNLREAWSFRELVGFFVWRDLKVRYKQTLIGAAWAVVQPLLTMVLFVVFFGKLARMPSGGLPYPVFFYVAILAWTYFAQAATGAAQSTVEHQNLITKVYFPRLLLPLGAVLSPLADFAVALVILFVLMAIYAVAPAWTIVLLPLFALALLVAALGVGLWLSALNARYRDVRYTLPFLMQLWLFASPVVYPSSLVPAEYRAWYGLNPIAGIIEGMRWATFGGGDPPGTMFLTSAAALLVLLAGGLVYFQRTERILADVV